MFRSAVSLAALAAATLLAGCLAIEETAFDASAVEPVFPFEDGAIHQFCEMEEGREASCEAARVSRHFRGGVVWARFEPPDAPDEPPSEILFFRHAGQHLALLRFAEGDAPGFLVLARTQRHWNAVILSMPLCGTADESTLGDAARAAGATVEESVCTFPDTASLLAFAASLDTLPLGEAFAEALIRK